MTPTEEVQHLQQGHGNPSQIFMARSSKTDLLHKNI
jgi:hypothetical protein